MTTTPFQGQTSYNEMRDVARHDGTPLAGHKIDRAYTNDRPRTAQVDTITVTGTKGAGGVHQFEVNTIAVSYTEQAGDAAADIAAGLEAALKAIPAVYGLVEPSAAAAVLTLTARSPGFAFTTTESDADLTLANVTANDEADPIPSGVGVLVHVGATGVETLEAGEPKCTTADQLTAKVVHYTPVVANDSTYRLLVWDAEGNVYEIAYLSDGSATAKEIVEGLVAAAALADVPSDLVTWTEDDAKVIATAAKKGQFFGLSASVTTSGTSVDPGTVADANGLATDDVRTVFAGVSLFAQNNAQDENGVTQYGPNQAVDVREEGEVYITPESWSGNPLEVNLRHTAVGANTQIGAFTLAPDAGTVRVPGLYFTHRQGNGQGRLSIRRR